ncbi:bromodomain containing protein, partial [Colletotrichum asianum]
VHHSSPVLLRPDQTRTTSQIVQSTAVAPEIKPRKLLPDDRLAWSLPREQKPDVSPTAWSNLPESWRPTQPKPQSQPEVKEEPERGLHNGLYLSLADAHLATSYILSIGPDLLMKLGKHARPSLLMRACCFDEKVIKGLVKIGFVNYNNNQALFSDQASISAVTIKWISMLREADAMGDRKKGLIHLMGSVALLLDDQDMFPRFELRGTSGSQGIRPSTEKRKLVLDVWSGQHSQRSRRLFLYCCCCCGTISISAARLYAFRSGHGKALLLLGYCRGGLGRTNMYR